MHMRGLSEFEQRWQGHDTRVNDAQLFRQIEWLMHPDHSCSPVQIPRTVYSCDLSAGPIHACCGQQQQQQQRVRRRVDAALRHAETCLCRGGRQGNGELTNSDDDATCVINYICRHRQLRYTRDVSSVPRPGPTLFCLSGWTYQCAFSVHRRSCCFPLSLSTSHVRFCTDAHVDDTEGAISKTRLPGERGYIF